VRKLILLPGMDGTGELFGPLLSELGSEFRTQVISYPRNEPLSYRELEALVRSALPENEPYVLVAESFSGPIAIRLASAGCSQALILCASFAAAPLPRYLRWLRHLVGRWSFRAPVPRWLLSVLLLGPHCPGALLTLANRVIRSVGAAVLANRLREVLTVDVRQELESTRVPILYLAPSRDRLLRTQPHRSIKELAQQLRFVRLKGPHLLLQRHPQQAAASIRAFLDEHTGSTWSGSPTGREAGSLDAAHPDDVAREHSTQGEPG
jgi:pimeloyl-ACP methyl ester carboxylesterase